MLELKALLLTQGMHGMVSQTEGLAKALKLNFKHQKIKLKTLWNLIPPKLTPISENLLTEKFVCDAKIIISCGRKSVIPSIALKKRFGKEIANLSSNSKIISRHHADSRFVVVAAASIIAKVSRDKSINRLRKNFELGSGYPSDKKSVKFVKKLLSSKNKSYSFIRFSWKPVQKILNKNSN